MRGFDLAISAIPLETLDGGYVRIIYSSIIVDDQAKALAFYRDVLGFVPKFDIPVGEFRWITLTSPDGPDDIELALEPNENPAAKTFQQAMFEQGIPLTSFGVESVQGEYERLTALGVVFQGEPTVADWGTMARFEDTCGNLIQIQHVT